MASSEEKLAQYKEQLAQVEAAIAQDPGNREWTTLRNDLLEVIELTGELGQIKSTAAPAKDGELRTYSVGEKCQAIFEMDGQWYNAKIVALAEDGYFVTFLGYGNTAQVEFNEVRPYQRPDTSALKPGVEVSAVHSDARWYDAVLHDVKDSVALVTFKGEEAAVEVDLDFVRAKGPSVERKRKQEEVEQADAAGKLPKNLEIRPDDSEEVAAKKKKKLNMFKRQEKKVAEEKQGETRRSSWQNFSKKNKTCKTAKNGHDPNWDPTRDHGELAARLQMEKYSSYLAREGAS
jgi:survival-of-motor-neuron-related-splicing factor 30